MDPNETVVVYRTDDTYQAEIICNALQNEGIECRVDGESQGGFVEIVESKLLVHASQADQARSIIEAHEQGRRPGKEHGGS